MLRDAPIDLLLDETTNDLVVTDDLSFSTGAIAVAQAIRIAVRMVKGEWFLDQDEGIPLRERDGIVTARAAILGQKFNRGKAIAAYRAAILAVEGVGSISEIDVQFDKRTRAMTVRWAVVTVFDEIIADTLEA